MAILVKGRNIEVTDTVRKYAERKLQRLARLVPKLLEVEIELAVERNPRVAHKQTVEVTMRAEGATLRASESSPDMYASIDLVAEKLEKRIERYKGKLYQKPSPELAAVEVVPLPEEEPEESEPHIVRVKRVPMKPMTPEEAAIQMELVGHDFFVFQNAETDEMNVLYRRKDKNYGLIGPVSGQ